MLEYEVSNNDNDLDGAKSAVLYEVLQNLGIFDLVLIHEMFVMNYMYGHHQQLTSSETLVKLFHNLIR